MRTPREPRRLTDYALWALGVIALASIVMQGGCVPMERSSTLEQKQRENVGQKATSEFVKSTETPPIEVTTENKDGTKTTVKTPGTSRTTGKASVGEDSDSASSGAWAWSESVPLFVKLIGLAVGLGMLGGIIWFAVNRSAALKSAWAIGDEFLSKQVNRIKGEAMASTDPAHSAKMSAIAAEMEHDRTTFNKD